MSERFFAHGLLPIALAIYTPNVLQITFLAKAIRASLSVLVLLVFYAPWLGTKGGALFSIIGSMVATIAWFLMGNPFGIDNAYDTHRNLRGNDREAERSFVGTHGVIVGPAALGARGE